MVTSFRRTRTSSSGEVACARHFPCPASRTCHGSSIRQGKVSAERLGNLPRTTQTLGGRTKLYLYACLLLDFPSKLPKTSGDFPQTGSLLPCLCQRKGELSSREVRGNFAVISLAVPSSCSSQNCNRIPNLGF